MQWCVQSRTRITQSCPVWPTSLPPLCRCCRCRAPTRVRNQIIISPRIMTLHVHLCVDQTRLRSSVCVCPVLTTNLKSTLSQSQRSHVRPLARLLARRRPPARSPAHTRAPIDLTCIASCVITQSGFVARARQTLCRRRMSPRARRSHHMRPTTTDLRRRRRQRTRATRAAKATTTTTQTTTTTTTATALWQLCTTRPPRANMLIWAPLLRRRRPRPLRQPSQTTLYSMECTQPRTRPPQQLGEQTNSSFTLLAACLALERASSAKLWPRTSGALSICCAQRLSRSVVHACRDVIAFELLTKFRHLAAHNVMCACVRACV